MNPQEIIGPAPEAFLTGSRGGAVLFHMELDGVVHNWVVSWRGAKVLFWTRHRGWVQIGRPISLN